VNTTCDFCKIESKVLGFDDAHGSMGGAMYGYFCEHCMKINDLYWQMNGVMIRCEMEISTNRRYFNRIKKEFQK
jgi:hypothetical protein